jgi:tRNA threonylcarbamoyladenosine biosynthesis protein TsaE
MQKQIVTHTANETLELGKEFAAALQRSDVVALYGELGSGKTQFAKGVCLGLGIGSHVTSPSFTIVNEYTEGRIPVYHFDFYRIRSLAELNEIGFDEYIFGSGVCLLEWANIVEERLPERRYDVTLALGQNHDHRIIQIDRVGIA